ncbi:MAG: N-6 DNA methylase [Bacteroidales bacterium]|nr:N-6 DNA methylase [Bacteroidales bacterium]
MSLFQKSVEKKYLNELDSVLIDQKYKEFQDYFGNPSIQDNIRNSKEEQFQEGFLRELFVSIFGYTLNPQPNFNLTTELKNIANSKKADGAILKGEDAIAVIELKGTDTTDLDKIETQAFGYKNHHPKCVYVITSNFEKLRFYIQNAVDHIDFDLFNLTREQFSLMWLCLAKENLLNGLPQKIKESSLLQEENITKKLYADYSKFREAIYNNLVKNNPDNDKLLLFKKTQKLLDRFLFIFFAEDRLLLPPNSISEIVKQWTTLKDELDEYVPLYDRFKKYFGYMNTGYKGKKYDIYAYNGGLFAYDEMLDNISIDDEILHKHTLTLSNYDFETDVDVNILGHIFEHSLGEIENVQAEIKGEKIDTQKTKRKKDGIFYTPKYITKYIVENTVGNLCEEKRKELEIVDEEYAKGRKNRKKDTIKILDDKLTNYRNWLLSLTILDPACGSGAFLNQALDFLITEHRKIDDLRAQLFGSGLVFSDITTDILEKNIYGVDLNEESVEIAKLSLWLRTAQKGRKLNKLNNNIKCGNSLIDNPEVAGEKAFNWQNEFPDIFANGGFDVVIGNPPYVQSHSISESEKEFIYKNFKTAEYQINTYGVFVEQFIKLLKSNSYYSLIIPNYWLSTKFDKRLRKDIFIDNHALEVINTYEVFESATVDTLILTGQKVKISNPKTLFYSISKEYKTIEERLTAINLRIWEYSEQKQFVQGDEENTIGFSTEFKLSGKKTLKDFFSMYQGMKPYEKGKGNPPQTREMMNEKVYHSAIKIDESYFPLLGARHIQRHYLVPFTEYIKYGKNLAAPRNPDIFKAERILINRILSKNKIDGVLLSDSYVNNTDVFNLIPFENNTISIKVLYALIVSKLCATYFKKSNVNLNRNAFPKINVNTLEAFPVPEISKEIQIQIELLIDGILTKTNEFQESKVKFIALVQDNLAITSVSKNLETFYESDFKNFLSELKKQKVILSLADQSEWKDYYEKTKLKINRLQTEIEKADKEIDQLVYELYGLTKEEIKIVEESL